MKSVHLPIDILMEQLKRAVTEKHEFDHPGKSLLKHFRKFATLRFLGQGKWKDFTATKKVLV